MRGKFLFFIIGLTLFSFAIRAYRFTEPNHYYFDEVYHAVTAKAYSDNNPEAYDPFAPAPKEGTAYDWLHPPFAKLIQAGSIKIFGDSPFGWRLPGLIIGTAIIPATYVLALLLFGPLTAVFASTVVAFENLTYVMSRITMNDVFLVFFIVTSFVFTTLYLHKKTFKYLVLTSIALGLAVSSKWTGAYAIAAVFVYLIFDSFKDKKLNLKLLLVLVLPPLIYLASYGQFWLQGHTITQFVDLHKQIWWYQNRHDLEHSYGTTPLFCVPHGLQAQKTWCPWILNVRGVYFSYEQYGQKAGYIYALGNPLIFWAGIIAVSYLIGKYLEKKDKKIIFVLLGYFVFWVPWIFSPRIMFLYHYLPSIPFMSIAIGYSLWGIYKSKYTLAAFLILGGLIFAFFYFYPISSGMPISPSSIENFMWLKSWR